jgi:VWFA-related protein
MGILLPVQSRAQSADAPTVAQPGIQIFVAFSDARGNSLPAPTKDMIQARVADKPAEVEEIRPLKDEPLIFSMVVDLSGSTKPYAEQQIEAASKLYRALFTGKSRGYLILFKDKLAPSDRFLAPEAVEDALRKFPAETRKGSTALYDAIAYACTNQLRGATPSPNSRRAVIVFSDGGDNASSHSLRETIELAQQGGVPVYAINQSKGVGHFSSRMEKLESQNLQTLSENTGGDVTHLREPGTIVEHLLSLLEGQTLLTVQTPPLRSGNGYPVKIESVDKNIHVLAQKEYYPH